MTPDATIIPALHAEYVRLTGISLPLHMGRETAWYEWLRRGLTIDDLRAIIADKKRRIAAGELGPQSLAFRNLVGNADYAEEDAAMLRSKRRTPPQNPARAEVLRASGRPCAPDPPPARSASQILADEAAFQKFKDFKKTLEGGGT